MRKQTIVKVLLLLLGVSLCALLLCACTTTPPGGSTQVNTTQASDSGAGAEDVTPDSYFEFTLLEDDTYEIAAKGEVELPTAVRLPSTHEGKPVTRIGDGAFSDCVSPTSIIIPDSVTDIGEGAFLGCLSLVSVTIPDSVKSIGMGAFAACEQLENIAVAPENSVYHSAGNCLIETETKTLVGVGKGFAIPTDGSVTRIGGAVFAYSSLTDIIIPQGVTSIGEGAFLGCLSLTSVTIPDSVTSIGWCAFYDCVSLQCNEYQNGHYLGNEENPCLVLISVKDQTMESFSIHESTRFIYDGAFYNCKSLTSITIPDSVTSIGSSAFMGCSALTSITIPDSVTSIGSSAFEGCSALKSINFENTNGWIFSKYSDMRNSQAVDVSDPVTVAAYLTSTYFVYYWERS